MANKKITELTGLNFASASGDDVLPIVDITADETKKITLTTLKSGSFSGSFSGDGSGLTGVVSASYAVSASHEITHEVSSSYAQTSSLALSLNATSSSTTRMFVGTLENGSTATPNYFRHLASLNTSSYLGPNSASAQQPNSFEVKSAVFTKGDGEEIANDISESVIAFKVSHSADSLPARMSPTIYIGEQPSETSQQTTNMVIGSRGRPGFGAISNYYASYEFRHGQLNLSSSFQHIIPFTIPAHNGTGSLGASNYIYNSVYARSASLSFIFKNVGDDDIKFKDAVEFDQNVTFGLESNLNVLGTPTFSGLFATFNNSVGTVFSSSVFMGGPHNAASPRFAFASSLNTSSFSGSSFVANAGNFEINGTHFIKGDGEEIGSDQSQSRYAFKVSHSVANNNQTIFPNIYIGQQATASNADAANLQPSNLYLLDPARPTVGEININGSALRANYTAFYLSSSNTQYSNNWQPWANNTGKIGTVGNMYGMIAGINITGSSISGTLGNFATAVKTPRVHDDLNVEIESVLATTTIMGGIGVSITSSGAGGVAIAGSGSGEGVGFKISGSELFADYEGKTLLRLSNDNKPVQIGYDAGQTTVNQGTLTLVGNYAGRNVHTNKASGGTFIGTSAGFNALHGTNNVLVGGNAGTNFYSGSSAVGIGYGVFQNATPGLNDDGTAANGTDTIGIGQSALLKVQGKGVIGIGAIVGSARTTGDYNILIGDRAGAMDNDSRDPIGHNIYIGRYAGMRVTGSNNLCIGHATAFTGSSVLTLNNQLRIGSGSTAVISGSLTTGDIILKNTNVQGNLTASGIISASNITSTAQIILTGSTGVTIAGSGSGTGATLQVSQSQIILSNLPTSNPQITGALWLSGSTTTPSTSKFLVVFTG